MSTGYWDRAHIYTDLYRTVEIDSLKDTIAWAANGIVNNRHRYEDISSHMSGSPPWYWVGIIHSLESGFNFAAHLHNGDPLSGRTYNVPAGRIPAPAEPPFTFEESAMDALRMKNLHRIHRDDWVVERVAYELERYNGWGYALYRDIYSPYLWSGTNHYTKGKYVSDGRYDPNAVSKQAGGMAVLHELEKRGVITVGWESYRGAPAGTKLPNTGVPADDFCATPEDEKGTPVKPKEPIFRGV